MKIKRFIWGAALLAPFALRTSGAAGETLSLSGLVDPASCNSEISDNSVDCTQGCDLGCGDNCGADCRGFWFAGTEFTFMGVDANSSGSGTVIVDDGLTPDVESTVEGAGGYNDFTYAPRIWVGRQFNDDWGLVGRFWYLSDYDASASILTPGVSDLAAGTESRIRMYTTDIEAVRSGTRGLWKLDASGGVRHALLDINSGVETAAFFNGTDFASAVASTGSGFEGTGLTGALTGRRRINDSNAFLFASARGSVLWGDADTYAVASSSAISGGAAAAATNGAIGSGDTYATIAEFQVGVQWQWKWRHVTPFFRTAFEYQNWDVDGDGFAFATNQSIANTTAAAAEASAGGGDVDLYGLAIGTGFTW